MFGWHKEDMDLQSINYLHYGRPKFWYGVDLDDNEKFE
jgi:jumonji domain-containing protein 2